MRIKLNLFVGTIILLLFVSACCKRNNDDICNPTQLNIQPFIEKRHIFQCNNSDEFTYVYRRKGQIDSLEPSCFMTGPVAFPADEANVAYILLGRTSYHYRDTISVTELLKDTCGKRIVYDVSMFQTDTTVNTFPGRRTIFCSVENIPADYEVEVKYRYVPLPE